MLHDHPSLFYRVQGLRCNRGLRRDLRCLEESSFAT
jgi:hypothetical protein